MRVHVPQSGNDVFAVGIDDLNVPSLANKTHLRDSSDHSFDPA